MDEDLKKPKHDDIMFWLTEWVKNPENVRPLMPELPYRRVAAFDHRLEPAAEEAVKAKDRHWHGFAYGERETRYVPRSEPLKSEPEPLFEFQAAPWEVPLKENNRTVAFADLMCEYRYCHELCGWHTQYYDAAHVASAYGGHWDFTPTRKALSFTQTPATARIFFEVKTDIISVGDLMRQLNYYKQTEQLQATRTRDEMPPVLAVVAPAHPEAESVCAAHGYGFVRYEP